MSDFELPEKEDTDTYALNNREIEEKKGEKFVQTEEETENISESPVEFTDNNKQKLETEGKTDETLPSEGGGAFIDSIDDDISKFIIKSSDNGFINVDNNYRFDLSKEDIDSTSCEISYDDLKNEYDKFISGNSEEEEKIITPIKHDEKFFEQIENSPVFEGKDDEEDIKPEDSNVKS